MEVLHLSINEQNMQIFDSTKLGLLSSLSNSSSLMSSGASFLLNPIFIHGFSGSFHLVLLLALCVSFVWKKPMRGEGSAESYFYCYENGWSDVELVNLFDVVLRTLSWGAISVYLYTLNSVSVFTALFLCYVGFLRHETQDSLLEQPFLNVDISSNTSNAPTSGSNKSRGGDEVTTKTLSLEDVPQLDSLDSVFRGFPAFRNKLESHNGAASRVTPFKLVKALFLSAWKEILWTALLAIIHTSASYAGPYLIDAFSASHRGTGSFRLQQVAFRHRAVITTMIYNKGLTLSNQSKQGQTSGEIINIMTVDADRIGDFSWYMHDPWLILFQVGLALLILYQNLGLASVAAFVATIVVMLINYPLGRLQETFQDKLMESKDKRMRATTEILRNMRILKLQGWEMKFLSKILELRDVETGWLKKYVYNSAMVMSVFWLAPTLVAVATFGACMLIGIPLESGKILSALATFRVLQIPIYNLPDTLSMTVQTKVSLDRIASYLCLDDLRSDVLEKHPIGGSDAAIEIADGNFSWDLSSPSATLKDINLRVLHGMRVAVCGTVGSGKSSLLSCILGELHKISGTLKLCGTKAYVAQSAWIQSGKIEENILFGKEMDRERYERVLEACSLNKDLEIMPFGDQTVIGERGINLSGGQKQRTQIARALYHDADIYLFDDPFSAVDAHTGSHLFKVKSLIFIDTIYNDDLHFQFL
ncbi:MULTIDRUG RESISTANCE PROTEIN ABC TRANSPORTER FAMILY PROTEIN [Salix purpurea]|uniref:ABC-type xenobiotic transporter n=1 Tax=Salix purpurea TaxID=77065 RepID=A0A9Q0VUS9_SALPP|nr:MULTIDRUG RESISTANCE PROTEIN ABC TRANSPORTER FAMILY PROTEIN [Salix purpurea]